MMDVVLTIVGLVILVVGADLMIRGAVDLALRARISPLVVGLTVVSMGTSAPELVVALMAALKGSSIMAVGAVVGSNISNLSLVLGACILVFPIATDRDTRRIHWPVMMLVSLLFAVIIQDDRMARWEGMLFVTLLVGYVTWMVWSSRRATSGAATASTVVRAPIWRSLLLLVLGVVGLGQGADWFVEGAAGIARTLGVSEQLIGVTVVAVGTSLPELVTSLIAAFRKQADISIGNLIGSNIFNLLGILGISAMVLPIAVRHDDFQLDLLFMLVIALLLLPFMWLFRRMGPWHGLLLLAVYALYILFVLQRG
ncbi:MAG: sodium:calcium antiporter [Flavobacteriales bacterium]|nr:sodium:calcium antiporter [Flavobacteriales bacterium]